MSTVAISYRSLNDASNEARDVSRKLEDYANELNNKILRKFNNYNGSRTSNINTARSHIQLKINELNSKSDKFLRLSNDLSNLEDECKRVDRTVRSKISSLTAKFKEANGIRNSHLENFFNFIFVDWANNTAFGRWISDSFAKLGLAGKLIISSIKEWFDYGGGKEFLIGACKSVLNMAVATLGIVAGVIAIVPAIVAGSVIAAIIAGAGIIVGVMGIVNAHVEQSNELDAYIHARQGDPATGRRRSDLDTLTDTIRNDSDNKLVHDISNGVDKFVLFCTFVNFVGNLGLGISKFSGFGAGTTVKGGVKGAKDFAKMTSTDFLSTLKQSFWDFSNTLSSVNSAKNVLSIPQQIFNGKSTTQVLIFNVLLKGIPIFNYSDSTEIYTADNIGDFVFDAFDYANSTKVNVFENEIDLKSIEKFSSMSDINIKIPEIKLPSVELPILR